MIVTLPKAKEYLRIDHDAEDEIVQELLQAAESLCMDVARMDEEEFRAQGAIAQTAVLYALAYFYEHRDEADHRALAVTIRSLLMGIRKEGF